MSQFDTRSKPADSQSTGSRELPAPKLDYDMTALQGNDQVTGGSPTVTTQPVAGANELFGRSYGEDAKPQAAASEAKKSDPEKAAKDLKAELAMNPAAVRSLDSLTGDSSYKSLTTEQKSDLLKQFQTAPNAATTNYLKAKAEYDKAKADDKSGDPAKEQARLAKLENARTPDAGSFSLDGKNYTIQNGKLMGKDGKEAGTLDNLGNYKMTGDEKSSNYYDNLSATVKLQEGQGKDQKTLLSLHGTDPRGLLTNPNMNKTFTSKVNDTLRAVRREGMDMSAAPLGSFRSFKDQNDLYDQGRSKPGKKVTGARGGESWHNYGLAADIAFYNDKGNITWPEQGDYAKQWTRYGQLAKKQGLRWGGDWSGLVDRPHVEYHPGLGDSQASSLIPAHRRGGLEAAWDQMGIGQVPNGPPPPQR